MGFALFHTIVPAMYMTLSNFWRLDAATVQFQKNRKSTKNNTNLPDYFDIYLYSVADTLIVRLFQAATYHTCWEKTQSMLLVVHAPHSPCSLKLVLLTAHPLCTPCSSQSMLLRVNAHCRPCSLRSILHAVYAPQSP